jgi:hypothetical protein
MITATNNRPLLARIGQAGIVALAAMVAVLAPSASRTASVESRLLAAGGERAMPIASAANFAATAIALRHWNKKEITVHVIASPNENKTAEQIASLVAQGLGLWNEKAGKTVHLSLTDDTDADVTVAFVTPGTLSGGAVGQTDAQFDPEDSAISHAGIKINERLSSAQLVQVVAHEMGHALGIQGHSPNKGDLMYAYAHLPVELTARDLNTLNIGYGISAPQQIAQK